MRWIKIKTGKQVLIFYILLLISLSVTTATAAVPDPIGYVNDFANVLSYQSELQIAEISQSLADNHGVEMAIVTMADIAPETPHMYAVEIFDQWGIGGPEDSGLLIFVVTELRDIQVMTGYGLEGVLPDGKVGAILDQFVLPHLAENDYDTGLVEAAKAYRAELIGESFLLEAREEESSEDLTAFIIFIVMAIIISIFARRNPPGTSGGSGSSRRRTVMFPTRFPGSGSGRSGGFGGFGGGRTGGGGAGRKF